MVLHPAILTADLAKAAQLTPACILQSAKNGRIPPPDHPNTTPERSLWTPQGAEKALAALATRRRRGDRHAPPLKTASPSLPTAA